MKFDTCLSPLIHGHIKVIKLIWHIFESKNGCIKFDVCPIKLVCSNSYGTKHKLAPSLIKFFPLLRKMSLEETEPSTAIIPLINGKNEGKNVKSVING